MQLDQQQFDAATTDSKRCLVLAGAGSGKTRTLIERIAHLIEQRKVSPYEVIAFTFTRKAAGEIKTRLEERIGSAAHKCTIGTMHAIALNMILRFGEQIGFMRSNNTTVYSQWEEAYLLKDIAMELGIFKKSWKPPKKEVDKVFADYYQRGIEPDELHPAYGLFKTFVARCKENNALTYGSLLVGLDMLIEPISKWLHFRHILVDEVQDIDPYQWKIINNLQRHFKASLFVVGDIDQSIYEWRGAVPKYLIEHKDRFDIFKIETNYRSDANIVYAANHLIGYNEDRLKKTMNPFEDRQTPIDVIPDMDSGEIVNLIKELNKTGPNAHRAVLSRNHALLKKLSILLKESGIKHIYIGKKTALTNSETFRRFHSFLKLVVNPYDNFSFLLIRDLIGLSRTEYQDIRSKAVKRGHSHFEIYLSYFPEALIKWTEFFNLAVDSYDLASIIESLRLELAQDELFEETIAFLYDFIKSNPTETLADYLEWLATYDLQDELTEDENILQIMTIHAAKGLEWPTVILAGINEELLPSKQAIKADDIEAERRLMYVAATRAEDRLIITIRPEVSISESGKVYKNPRSRFVEEMGL